MIFLWGAKTVRDLFLVSRGCVICWCQDVVQFFLVPVGCVIFLVPRGCVIFFGDKTLRDFFLVSRGFFVIRVCINFCDAERLHDSFWCQEVA